MNLLRKFMQLPMSSKLIIGETLFWMVFIHIGLRLSNFKKMDGLLKIFTKRKMPGKNNINMYHSTEMVVWAVNAVGNRLPGLPCLRNAMTAKIMLAKRGCEVHVRIGVRRQQVGKISAHAWVEKQGQVIIGGCESPALFTIISTNETLFKRLISDLS